ncbi:hypothetical protein [Actibacterium ureilyticum]|uniref:hypothetical protein n=1 Tax=Actibacterium ureilyticum TaxID=1590614 RepID=UPI0015951FAC|nr:hypothetical protein [Actibacterium ureilyticum]
MVSVFQRFMVIVVLAAGLAGCADEIEEQIGECEPGVSELSRVDPTPPPGC